MAYHQKTWKSRRIKSQSRSFKSRSNFSVRNVYSHKSNGSLSRFIIKKLLYFIFILGILSAVFISLLFLYYSRDLPSLDSIKSGSIVIPESTKIYDRTGDHLLYTIHGEENRTRIKLGDIPDYVKWATISTEDQDFYTRGFAIDFKGIARALIAVLKNRSITQGPGGSTITQQLVKNLILTREKTISRKIKEIILAFRIEKALSRDEILELYLNQIPYGSNAYGIEQAAQTFFSKSAKELTLSESALLAALPKATTYYSPFGSHVNDLMERHKIILRQMLNEGYITEDELNKALEEKLAFKSTRENIEAPHFVMYVKEILAHRFGEQELEQGGLRVITTLDYRIQKVAEEIVKKWAKINEKNGADNAALVAIDPKNGDILAMVGSKDYFDVENDGNFNVALAERQPGSSFKPIVYASLFTKGYTPNTILFDVETDFDPRDGEEFEYIPKDFDLKERGPVTIRKALAGSLNIPAVRALYLAGINTVIDYAAKLGYSTLNNPKDVGLSLALGGGGVKLLEHVGAFAVFANNGVRHQIRPILKVEKSDGSIIEEAKEKEGTRVFPKNVALMITDILSDNQARSYIFGENNYLFLGDRPAAAKTGTTNDSRDAWTVGYTPQIAAGIWVGNNDNSPMNKNVGGSKAAAPIWNEFMKNVLENEEIIPFEKPEIPKTGKPILDGDIEGVVRVKIDTVTGKLATQYTPLDLVKEVSFASFHSILHYIDKDNPLGPSPKDPSLDPQYKNWEEAIERWAKESKEANEIKTPPTEYDDVHIPENIPSVTIISPKDKDTIKYKSVFVNISAFAKRGISKVEYYIDGEFRESSGLKPFSRTIYFGNIPDGKHKITVKVFDDVGNRTSRDVEIYLERGIKDSKKDIVNPSALILSPKDGSLISKDQFPLLVLIYLNKPLLVERVNLYYNDKYGNPIVIGSKSGELPQNLKIEWTDPPKPGKYPLYVVVIDKNGKSYRTEISVSVN